MVLEILDIYPLRHDVASPLAHLTLPLLLLRHGLSHNPAFLESLALKENKQAAYSR